jgi:hypothetical protein
MTEKQKIPWNRVSVEAVAIVASILLAFSIDAWWDEQLERSDELQELARLQIELDTNINRIDQFPIIKQASDAGLEILGQIVNAQSNGLQSVEVSTEKLFLLSIAPTFEADAPVLDGLVRSGRLEIVIDPRVIAALASWERRMRDYSEVALLARRNVDTLLVPALVKRGDVAFALIGSETFDVLHSIEFLSDAPPVVTIDIDREIKGLIAQKVENTGRAIHLLQLARMAAEEALVAIQAARSS